MENFFYENLNDQESWNKLSKILTARLLQISVLDCRYLYGVCTVGDEKKFISEKILFTRNDA